MSALLPPLPALPTPTSALDSILHLVPATTAASAPVESSADELLIHEPVPLAGLPLAPLCDERSLASAPLAEDDEAAPLVRVASRRQADASELRGWRLRFPSGELASPLTPDGWSSTGAGAFVLDVHAGLLHALAEAGFPPDGRVQVARHSFLRRIGWAARGTSSGGRQYAQLDAAVRYLTELEITSTTIAGYLDASSCAEQAEPLTLRVLEADERHLRPRSRDGRSDADPQHVDMAAHDIVIRFSKPFMRALQSRDHRVTYRLRDYLAFGAGGPRALFRYVQYLAALRPESGLVLVDLDEVFAALGSARRGAPPSKLRQLVREADQALVDKGYLQDRLTCRTIVRDGKKLHQVLFRLAAPPTTAFKALLRETLIAYKVRSSYAQKLTESNADRLEWVATVLAATTLGMLEPKKDLPAMIVDYCKQPDRLLDADQLPRFRPTARTQRRTDLTLNDALQFLDESHTQNERFLRGLSAADLRTRRAAYEKPGRPGWVVDGLMLAAARSDRQGWTLDAFLKARGARAR